MVLSGAVSLVAVVKAWIEEQLRPDKLGDGEVDGVVPFPDVVVVVAHPIDTAHPVDLLAYLPAGVQRDAGTERRLLVLTLLDAVVLDEVVVVDVDNPHGKRCHLQRAGELLLLAPCYVVLHTGGNGDVKGRKDVGVLLGAVALVGWYQLCLEDDLKGVVEVLPCLVAGIRGISEQVVGRAEGMLLVALRRLEAKLHLQGIVPTYLSLVVVVGTQRERGQTREVVFAALVPVAREVVLRELQRGIARELPEVRPACDDLHHLVHLRSQRCGSHLVGELVLVLQHLVHVGSECRLRLDVAFRLHHQQGSPRVELRQHSARGIESLHLRVKAEMFFGTHHLLQRRGIERGAQEKLVVVRVGLRSIAQGIERVTLHCQRVQRQQISAEQGRRVGFLIGLHLYGRTGMEDHQREEE